MAEGGDRVASKEGRTVCFTILVGGGRQPTHSGDEIHRLLPCGTVDRCSCAQCLSGYSLLLKSFALKSHLHRSWLDGLCHMNSSMLVAHYIGIEANFNFACRERWLEIPLQCLL